MDKSLHRYYDYFISWSQHKTLVPVSTQQQNQYKSSRQRESEKFYDVEAKWCIVGGGFVLKKT